MTSLLPVAVAAFAVLLCAATGFTQRSLFGTALEDTFYGYFFRNYPLFLFATVYGAARIVQAALTEPGPRKPLRALTTPLAVALFLAACFYPTFGGFVLRPGFATGGVSFLRGQSAEVAHVLGAGAAAVTFGLILGLCTLLAKAHAPPRWRAVGGAALSGLALWVGALILQAPQQLGIDLLNGFPLRALGWSQALAIAGLVALATLPHALAVGHPARRRSPQSGSPNV